MSFNKLEVIKIDKETADAISIHFKKPGDDSYNYTPGQYLTLKVEVNGEVLNRAYSLCSSPYTDEDLVVTVKRVEDGRVSNYLNTDLEVGQSLEVLTPRGNFVVEPDADRSHHYVLIGGGSGITPLLSILKSILEKEANSQVTLIYGNRDEASIIFHEVLKNLEASSNGKLKVLYSLDNPSDTWTGISGMLDRNKLLPILQDVVSQISGTKSFHLCGPAGMMDEVKQTMAFLGISKKEIHQELFTAPLPKENDGEETSVTSAGDGGHEHKKGTYEIKAILDGKEKMLTINPDQSILEVAIQEGMDPPFACQMGICTTCRAMCHSGAVEMDETEGLSDQEIEEGFVLTCQSHPLTPDVVIEFK